ncbi:MAG: nucleotidyltransferase domain-containing protein [Methanomassiliicoccaceae archaeon]|nr:nucleotidyltransferase domain-containing protein [Methanomassiliicoccaceae archaeon]
MRIDEAVEMVREQTGKAVAVCSLTGSRNQNLNSESSDHDMIAFVVPTLDDMYGRSEYFKEIKGKGFEINVHDLRKLPDLLWRSNPSALELLFSEERHMSGGLDTLLYGNRERIAGMNLPYLYNSSVGTCRHKMKSLEKGTISTQHLVQMYGYDTKQGMHALRMLHLLEWYADDGRFETAIRFDGTDKGKERREFLLSVRNGKFTLNEMKDAIENKIKDVEERYKERYMNAEPDREMIETIRTKVKEFVLRGYGRE